MGAWHTVGPRQHALLCKALSAVCSSSAGPPDSGSEPPPATYRGSWRGSRAGVSSPRFSRVSGSPAPPNAELS